MIELLSPAGDREKLLASLRFGADAVYLGGRAFGMRSASKNFDADGLREALSLSHSLGKKVYLTVNIQPREEEYPLLSAYLEALSDFPPDALIVADLGVLSLARRLLPRVPLHISTQANVMSSYAALAYAELGAERIVLSRELSLAEIERIRKALPERITLEAFVHGAMCIAYSGRCLLSNYLTGRDAGHGSCTQPCRWHYKAVRVEIEEEKREGELIPLEEREGETFFLGSRDLSMIAHVPELLSAGISSFKIEGRVKSAYYTAVITNAYRMAIDAALRGEPFNPLWERECESVSHRPYGTGFYFQSPHLEAAVSEQDGYLREKAYLASVISYDPKTSLALLEQRNKFSSGDDVELLTPGRVGIPFRVNALYDEEGKSLETANHPMMRCYVKMPFPVKAGDLLREGSPCGTK